MARKTGRRNKYETHVKARFDEIRRWCEIGTTDKEIIEMLGISTSTFYDYKQKHAEFSLTQGHFYDVRSTSEGSWKCP